MRIIDWSSDLCSSDLPGIDIIALAFAEHRADAEPRGADIICPAVHAEILVADHRRIIDRPAHRMARDIGDAAETRGRRREHRQYLRRQIVEAAVVVARTEFEGQRGGGPDGHGARQAGEGAVADRSAEHTAE